MPLEGSTPSLPARLRDSSVEPARIIRGTCRKSFCAKRSSDCDGAGYRRVAGTITETKRRSSFVRERRTAMARTALKDRVAFITGAASGIGAALAVEYTRLGADIVLFDRRHQSLRQT